ncbi:ribonuclease H-like domain-containing protein [Tanacetum coccineum]
MWLFHHKYLAYDTLRRYKTHIVANGSTQLEGIDVNETISPVVKTGTIRTVLVWLLLGFWDYAHPDYAWADTAYLSLYDDDIVLTASSEVLLQQIIASLHQGFSMTDLSSLNDFLGIFVTRDFLGMFLSQCKYAAEILEQAHMVNCNLSRTHVDIESKLGDDGDPVSDPTLYRSLAGSLQYLTFTRPDISYAVLHVCFYMHDLREPYFSALKRILRYVRGTLDHGLQEYRGVANAIAETCWLRNLLLVAGQIRVLHVPSRYQYANIFTKGLHSVLYKEFRTTLSVRCPPPQTAGEC